MAREGHPEEDATGSRPLPIPLSLFGIPFGLAGLAGAWAYAARMGLAPSAIRDGLAAVAALVWLAVLAVYVGTARSRPRRIAEDLAHPVQAPFATLVVLVPLLLTVDLLLPGASGVAATLVDVLAALVVLLGGWLTGQWIYEPLSMENLHPGYFLPTTAGALLASAAASACAQPTLAEFLFGLGIVSWLIVGPMILLRLLCWPPLPPALMPTLAIEVAPAPAATLAYLALNGGRIDAVAAGLGGYATLMIIAQVRLVPGYLKLGFAPSFWAFTFSWAVAATAGLARLGLQRPEGWRVWSWIILTALTLLIVAIAARTVLALRRRDFLSPGPPPH